MAGTTQRMDCRRSRRTSIVVGAAALVATLVAQGAEVTVIGVFPGKAVVVIDKSPPRTVTVGMRTPEGVQLLGIDGERATFDINGQRRTFAMGQHYATRATGAAQKVVLTAGEGGHFMADGRVNGGTVRFMVDTGATTIALPASDARRLGINYLNAPRGMVQTANGAAPVYRVTLDKVEIGDITINSVEAMILERGLNVALLGMSFLSRTNMQREGETLTLIRRF